MADTPRTRAANLVNFQDNVTGGVSAQDARDLIVSILPAEHLYATDFYFVGPGVDNITTDKTARGWVWHSMTAHSNQRISTGLIYYLNTSDVLKAADASISAENQLLVMALDSYTSGTTGVSVLVKGIFYNSTWSTRLSGCVGKYVYLNSAADSYTPSMSITDGGLTRIIGYVMPGSVGQSIVAGTAGKMWFDGMNWAVTGA